MVKSIDSAHVSKSALRERDLHDDIEADLKNRRWYYVHSRTDKATTQQAGVTDFIIAAPNGLTIWIECKIKGNKLSKEQSITRHVLLALGHIYATVYSFEEYQQTIKRALGL